MVDAGTVTPPRLRTRPDAAAMPARDTAIGVEVEAADAAALAGYDAFCREGVHGPAQHPLWVRAWNAAHSADALVVTARRDGKALLKLALEVVARGPFRVARFVGGSHANGNFAACAPDMAPASPAEGAAIAAALRKARPDIDLVSLSRQAPHFEGRDNPLAALATRQSPNLSLAVDLDGGFEAVLSRHGGSRKRQKFNYQRNRFNRAGGYRLIEATTLQEAERLIETFFVLKGASLRAKGIPDAFADEKVRDFFRTLAREALAEDDPPFLLHGVEVAGEIVAINGLSVTRETVVCNFGTYSDADPRSSPGYFIDYTNIEQACGQGRRIYDFSVGDEPYKRSWCDIETRHFETLLPLSLKGHLLALHERGSAAAIQALKSNPTAWDFVKRMRTRLGGERPTAG
jgi:CelD/BcsL family acetyltransferase involved in cellulose biosynthesis